MLEKIPACNARMLHSIYSELLNSGHLRVLKHLSVIKRCPLLGGSLTKIVTFGTKPLFAIQGTSAIWDVCYREVSLHYVSSIYPDKKK